jgi:SAM-dependent methyltransferase
MKTTIIRRNGRLEMFREGADTPAYWDAHWAQHPPEPMTGMGMYCGFRDAINSFMPRDGVIVEAGCGNGNTARTIRAAGFQIEGIDFAPKVIDANRSIDPEGVYRVADVRAMDDQSNSLAGYMSFGVIEHFSDVERRAILLEAARCLQPGGVALFTVPHYNLLRRARFGLSSSRQPPTDTPFYQYFFSASELTADLRAVGLQITHVDAYDAYKGIKDTIGGKPFMDRLRAKSPRWRRRVDHPARWIRQAAGHMLLVIATKPAADAMPQQKAA